MKHTDNFKYKFDEQTGIFVRESEISVNWLLSQILGIEDLQITKVSNDDIQKFLHTLDSSDLRLPDGKHSLIWLKEQLKEKYQMSNSQNSEAWHTITERYSYILEQIDLILINSNYEEKNKIVKDNDFGFKRTPNNITASFEPL